jgi:hypothetical protein
MEANITKAAKVTLSKQLIDGFIRETLINILPFFLKTCHTQKPLNKDDRWSSGRNWITLKGISSN